MQNLSNIVSRFPKIDHNLHLLINELEDNGAQVSKVIDGIPVLVAKKGKKKEIIFDLTTSITSFTSAWVASDKYLTKKWLSQFGISVPEGKVFYGKEAKEAVKYSKKIGYPVVAKITQGSHGDYVFPELESKEEVEEKINILKREKIGEDGTFLLEKHVYGKEFRLFITNKGFFAVVYRFPPIVVGDGKNSILGLIQIINHERTVNRVNCLCDIKLNQNLFDYLEKQRLNVSYIPKKGEIINIRPESNVSQGGGCYEVTNETHSSFKVLAEKILSLIPGLSVLGIDIICEDNKKAINKQEYSICELNVSPGLSLHMQPEKGFSQNAARAVAEVILSIGNEGNK